MITCKIQGAIRQPQLGVCELGAGAASMPQSHPRKIVALCQILIKALNLSTKITVIIYTMTQFFIRVQIQRTMFFPERSRTMSFWLLCDEVVQIHLYTRPYLALFLFLGLITSLVAAEFRVLHRYHLSETDFESDRVL